MVVDASAFVDSILGLGEAVELRSLLRDPDAEIHVPELCDVEIVSAMRKRILRRRITIEMAETAIEEYVSMPLERHGHESLMGKILAFRDVFTAYDAAYIALAEVLDASFVSSDRALVRSVRAHTTIDVLPL